MRIKVLDKISDSSKTIYKTIAYIDSYKGVPLVNLHAIYESSMDEAIFGRLFRSRIKEDSRTEYFIYTFDYPKHGMYIEQGTWGSSKVEHRDTLHMDTLYQDGLSLFYYARAHVAEKHELHIPTVVKEKKVKTTIKFLNERTSEKIDAVNYPIDVIHFEGDAEFVGIFGLTGAFEGWFTSDPAHVPIVANMKVIIGNIRIELMKWNREGWTPPRYVEGNR